MKIIKNSHEQNQHSVAPSILFVTGLVMHFIRPYYFYNHWRTFDDNEWNTPSNELLVHLRKYPYVNTHLIVLYLCLFVLLIDTMSFFVYFLSSMCRRVYRHAYMLSISFVCILIFSLNVAAVSSIITAKYFCIFNL
jgi:Na+/melibiose symporter-like transporter